MNKIIVTPLESVRNEENSSITKTYLVNNEKIIANVDRLAVEPLRILETILIQKGCKIKSIIDNGNAWNIRELEIEYEEYIAIDEILKEIMEYRCCPECNFKWTDIIRQLPYNVLIQVSNTIMAYGKDEITQQQDSFISSVEWDFHRFMAGQMGVNIIPINEDGNPNEVNNCLAIAKDQPEKRKHLIYKSSRGGYNIKTQNYRDSSMDHYCWNDSGKWD